VQESAFLRLSCDRLVVSPVFFLDSAASLALNRDPSLTRPRPSAHPPPSLPPPCLPRAPQNDLQFFRLRVRGGRELIAAPGDNILILVVQSWKWAAEAEAATAAAAAAAAAAVPTK
jgi:hypothetical protein